MALAVVFYLAIKQSEDTFFPRNDVKSRNCLINTVKKGERCPYKPSAYILAEAAVGTPGTVEFWLLRF